MGDKWLPLQNGFNYWSVLKEVPSDSTIDKVIDIHIGDWKHYLTDCIFLLFEVVQIKAIPLSHQFLRDHLVWHYSNKNTFSVQSAYHLALTSKEPVISETSSMNNLINQIKLWALSIPLKIKHFGQHLLKDHLLTRTNMCKRGMQVKESYVLCAKHIETTHYVFMHYEWPRGVWFLSTLSLRVDDGKVDGVENWLFSIITLKGLECNQFT